MMFWRAFWHIFIRSPAVAPPCWLSPSTRFYCYYRPPEDGRSPAGLWFTVRRGTSHLTYRFPVLGCVEWGGGGGFAVRPLLLLNISGPVAPHRSEQVPKTGRLYSAVTHHTHNPLHVPGSLYLDLASLLLLIKKWGLALPHPFRDAPHSSWFDYS
jgi:hypothetical protein